MSEDGKFSSESGYLEYLIVDLSRKYEENKKIVEETRLLYMELASNVETMSAEVNDAKLERFQLESVLQQAEISVSILEQSKLTLEADESRIDSKIRELELLLKAAYENRDSADRNITSRVQDLAEEYRQYVRSCDRYVVGEQLESLNAEDKALQGEFEKLTLQISEASGATSSVERLAGNGDIRVKIFPKNRSEEADDTIDAIRQLQAHVEKEIQLAVAQNEISEAELSRLNEEKSVLEEEINKLKGKWG